MKTGFLWAACRPLASALCVFVLGATASAQTVRPVINELVGNPVKGRVEYVNDSLTRLNVVFEARSFTVVESGDISYRPLDPRLHVKSSATSFRIQPQQTYYVFYEAISPQVPAWFVIYANFTGFAFRRAQGHVRLQLPHTICLQVPLEQKPEGENVPVDVSLELEKFRLEQELERHSSTGAVSAAATSTAVPAVTRGGDKPYTR